MPDDPNTHAEGSFMAAAEAIVDRLIRGLRFQLRVTLAAIVMLSVVLAALGFVVKSQYDATSQLRQNSVSACQAGNSYRAQQTQIWSFFLDIAVAQGAGKDVKSFVTGAAAVLSALTAQHPELKSDAAKFVSLLERLSGEVKDPRTPALVKAIKAHVAAVNAPRNCVRAYNASARG